MKLETPAQEEFDEGEMHVKGAGLASPKAEPFRAGVVRGHEWCCANATVEGRGVRAGTKEAPSAPAQTYNKLSIVVAMQKKLPKKLEPIRMWAGVSQSEKASSLNDKASPCGCRRFHNSRPGKESRRPIASCTWLLCWSPYRSVDGGQNVISNK